MGRLDFCESFESVRVEQFNQELHKNKCHISTEATRQDLGIRGTLSPGSNR